MLRNKSKAICLVILFAMTTACRAVDCGNEVHVNGLSSTDGERRAFIFMRNCGATTGMNSQVSVLPAFEALPDEAGNVFICDQPPETLQMSWTDAHTLRIIYPEYAQVFLQRDSLGGASISYETRP